MYRGTHRASGAPIRNLPRVATVVTTVAVTATVVAAALASCGSASPNVTTPTGTFTSTAMLDPTQTERPPIGAAAAWPMGEIAQAVRDAGVAVAETYTFPLDPWASVVECGKPVKYPCVTGEPRSLTDPSGVTHATCYVILVNAEDSYLGCDDGYGEES